MVNVFFRGVQFGGKRRGRLDKKTWKAMRKIIAMVIAMMMAIAGEMKGEHVLKGQYENILWSYDVEEETLEIGGEGRMPDFEANIRSSPSLYTWYRPGALYGYSAYAPWSVAAEARTLIIGGGITHIGKNAFHGMNNLEYISWGGVEEIGDYAFYGCDMIDNFVLPSWLKKIGVCAFGECCFPYIVCEAPIPPEIDNTSFQLDYYPYSTRPKLLRVCSAEAVEAYKQDEKWSALFSDILTNKVSDNAIWITTESKFKSIRESLAEGGMNAEDVFMLQFQVSEGVTLSDDDFDVISEMRNLSYIDMGSVLNTHLPQDIFKGHKNISYVRLPRQIDELPSFTHCFSLTEVVTEAKIKCVPQRCFLECYNLRKFRSESVEEVGAYSFQLCTNLETLYLPNCSHVGMNAILCDVRLKNLTLKEGVTVDEGFDRNGVGMIKDSKGRILCFTNGIGYVSYEAWKADKKMFYDDRVGNYYDDRYVFADGKTISVSCEEGELKSVVEALVSDADEVSEMKIVGTLNAEDFKYIRENMVNLRKLDIGDISNTTLSEDEDSHEALSMRSLVEVVLPKGLESLNLDDFAKCGYMRWLEMPANVRYFSKGTECGKPNLEFLFVDEDNKTFEATDGVLTKKEYHGWPVYKYTNEVQYFPPELRYYVYDASVRDVQMKDVYNKYLEKVYTYDQDRGYSSSEDPTCSEVFSDCYSSSEMPELDGQRCGKYYVTFYDKDGGWLDQQEVESGEDATPPDAPEYDGYEFSYWDGNYTSVYQDEDVWAVYDRLSYTVTFVDWDDREIDSQTVEYGEDAVAPIDPEREGYTFTGWDRDVTNITSDETIRAVYEVTKYTVKFVDWDGKTLKSETVEHGMGATAPSEPKREGYEFDGWGTSFASVTGNLTVTAKYKKVEVTKYTVTFVDWDGKTLKTEEVEHGNAATAPTNPTRTGYTFTGWIGEYTNVVSDVTVTAKYEKKGTTTEDKDGVDLGLPSGTIWAKTNLGAKNEKDAGDFFAWGEKDNRESFSWENYGLGEGTWDKTTKYTGKDGKKRLAAEDDAAKVRTKNVWRMPTRAEMEELIEKCTWKLEGEGFRVTGPNGRSIYLPLGGLYMESREEEGAKGMYWGADIWEGSEWMSVSMYLSNERAKGQTHWTHRRMGLMIRPVK